MEGNESKQGLGIPSALVKTGALFLIVISVFFAIRIQNEIKGYSRVQQPHTINVTGEGKQFAKPDIATVSVGVVKTNTDLLKAQRDAADIINRVTALLKDKKISEKDQKTVSYSISPQYDWTDKGRIFKGYEIRQTLEIKIRDLNIVGDVLAGVAGAGANEIGSLGFTVDDPSLIRNEVRKQAIEDAKKQAEILAKSLNVRLGKIISYSEYGGGAPPPIYFGKAEYGVGGDGLSAPSVPTGENEIRINVTITYEIN